MFTVKYNIYVGETKGVLKFDEVVKCLKMTNVQGATLTKGWGFWEGEMEGCVVVTILGNANDEPFIYSLCEYIRERLNQDAVLLESCEIQAKMFERRKTPKPITREELDEYNDPTY